MKNTVYAALFHLTIFLVAYGTVTPEGIVFVPRWSPVFGGFCSIAFYVLIPVSTQVPQLLFANPDLALKGAIDHRRQSRFEFIMRVFLFWGFIGAVFSVQVLLGSSEKPLDKGIARWLLLLGLCVFFSVMDYAVPSYGRYTKLVKERKWGAKAQVILK